MVAKIQQPVLMPILRAFSAQVQVSWSIHVMMPKCYEAKPHLLCLLIPSWSNLNPNPIGNPCFTSKVLKEGFFFLFPVTWNQDKTMKPVFNSEIQGFFFGLMSRTTVWCVLAPHEHEWKQKSHLLKIIKCQNVNTDLSCVIGVVFNWGLCRVAGFNFGPVCLRLHAIRGMKLWFHICGVTEDNVLFLEWHVHRKQH